METTTTPAPQWLTVPEAAAIARRTEKAMRQLRYRGLGPNFRRVDGRLLVSRADLEQWLAGESTAAA